MTSIDSVASLTLEQPPSCIAFCPTQPQYLVVGTYLLHAKAEENALSEADDGDDHGKNVEVQKRSGSLVSYRLAGNDLIHVATKPTPDFSILDIQWTLHPSQLGRLLAVASSTGLLVFYKLDEHGQLIHVSTNRVCDSSTLVLSLCWHPSQPGAIGLTLSDGRICICESTGDELWRGDGNVCVTDIYQHSLEAWMSAFAPPNGSQTEILSGGDDQVLHRSAVGKQQTSNPLWQDRRIHQAGVTAILPLTDELIVTGSYDDHIRLISAPSTGRRQVLAEEDLGGGVWRMKLLLEGEGTGLESAAASAALPDANRSLIILASCMHAGTRIVRLLRTSDADDAGWKFEVLTKFEEHKSMNYGSDVQPDSGARKTIVSTSFYDKLLCLWRFDMHSLDQGGG